MAEVRAHFTIAAVPENQVMVTIDIPNKKAKLIYLIPGKSIPTLRLEATLKILSPRIYNQTKNINQILR